MLLYINGAARGASRDATRDAPCDAATSKNGSRGTLPNIDARLGSELWIGDASLYCGFSLSALVWRG